MDNKKFYEKCLGQRISESTWNRDKARMRIHNLALNKENLSHYAKVKIQAKKFSLPIDQTFSYFFSLQATASLGIDIHSRIFQIFSEAPHRTTLYRWFPGGYQPNKEYSSSEVSEILLHALIYKMRTEKNATRKQTFRSYQISA